MPEPRWSDDDVLAFCNATHPGMNVAHVDLARVLNRKMLDRLAEAGFMVQRGGDPDA